MIFLISLICMILRILIILTCIKKIIQIKKITVQTKTTIQNLQLMKRIALFLLPVFLFLGNKTMAQNITDALRYSTLNYGGTARSMGAGNALGALGADYSVLSTNPAGLANFRTNELVFTPAIRFTNTDATLKNGGDNLTVSEQRTNFHFDNAGLVFYKEPRGSKWTTANFAIGFNQLANFSQRTYYDGRSKGSILDGWHDEAKSVAYDTTQLYGLGAGLAAQTYALYFQGADTMQTDFSAYPNATIARSQDIRESGRINEMVLSFAGNYDEKVSLGMTLGVPFYSFTQRKRYIETDPGAEVLYFDRLQFDETLKTSGIGVNLKLGAIWRVNQNLRLGAAFHTPTLTTMTDNFEATLKYDYSDASGAVRNEAEGIAEPFDYGLKTPWRAIGSVAFLVPRVGFLSADVEFLDYSKAKFDLTKNFQDDATRQYESELNKELAATYASAVNIRLGGEAVAGRLRVRAGYNLFGTPFDARGTKNFPNSAISFGVGVRKNWFYMDLGYRYSKGKEQFTPYVTASGAGQTVDTEAVRHDCLLTFGFKF